jgi:integrase
VYCKAWPVRESKCFSKQAFALDWERQTIRCPAEQEMPFVPGGIVHFPKDTCAQCPLQTRCTISAKGRGISIHPDEALLIELRERQQTSEGRDKLRERVAVEHTLAHVGQWQGRRARYRGVRKNLFDLRRCAVVHNLDTMPKVGSSGMVSSAATILLSMRVDMKVIQELLGRSHFAMTADIYSHVSPAMQRAAMDKWEGELESDEEDVNLEEEDNGEEAD